MGEAAVIKIFGHFIPTRLLALALLDIIVLICLIELSEGLSQLVTNGASEININKQATALLLAPLCSVFIWAMGFYRTDGQYRQGKTFFAAVSAACLAVLFGSLAIIALRIFLGFVNPSPISWSLLFVAVCVFLVCLLHSRLLPNAQSKFFCRKILLIGNGPRAAAVDALASNPDVSITIKKRIKLGASNIALEVPPPGQLRREGIREIVVATEEHRGLPMERLLLCKLQGLRVTDYLTFTERETGCVDLKALQPAWLIYGEGCRRGVFGEVVKRVCDVLIAISLITLTAPLLIVAMLAILSESRGPILYAQDRVGFNGRIFTLLKFRSMRTDAERQDAPQWATTRDPRITRVGRLLRPMRIDELPQLINVLRGDMSLIGPRPERPFFVDQLSKEIPFYHFRQVVKPGLTGWAQINAPYAASVEETRIKLSYDLYYVKNRSFFLDLYIALATIRVVLLREGAN